MFLTRRGNDGICVSNLEKVKEYAKRFSQGHCTFLGLGNEKSGMELFLAHLKENGILQPLTKVERFEDTGHPAFKGVSALIRGILQKKHGKDTHTHQCG